MKNKNRKFKKRFYVILISLILLCVAGVVYFNTSSSDNSFNNSDNSSNNNEDSDEVTTVSRVKGEIEYAKATYPTITVTLSHSNNQYTAKVTSTSAGKMSWNWSISSRFTFGYDIR